VELFVEFFDLLMGLRLDPCDVIPWASEMGDDLIEPRVKGRGVPVLRVLEDEDHQQGCDADGDVGPIDPEAHQSDHDKQGGDEERPRRAHPLREVRCHRGEPLRKLPVHLASSPPISAQG
jgi:hypothetical protein